jgi:hypothetical protein
MLGVLGGGGISIIKTRSALWVQGQAWLSGDMEMCAVKRNTVAFE